MKYGVLKKKTNNLKKRSTTSASTAKKKRNKPEWYIQKDIVDFVHNEHSDWVLFSVPNEAIYRRREYFHQIGALSGASDLVLVNGDGVFFIECKAPKGRQSIEQRQFEANVCKFGYTYAIVHSLDEFKEAILN